MKININAELNSEEICAIFTDLLKQKGIESSRENFILEVFSEKVNKWIQVKDIRVIFNKQ